MAVSVIERPLRRTDSYVICLYAFGWVMRVTCLEYSTRVTKLSGYIEALIGKTVDGLA